MLEFQMVDFPEFPVIPPACPHNVALKCRSGRQKKKGGALPQLGIQPISFTWRRITDLLKLSVKS